MVVLRGLQDDLEQIAKRAGCALAPALCAQQPGAGSTPPYFPPQTNSGGGGGGGGSGNASTDSGMPWGKIAAGVVVTALLGAGVWFATRKRRK